MKTLLCALVLSGVALAGETNTLCLRVAQWEFPKGTLTSEQDPVSPVKRFTVQLDDGEEVDVSAHETALTLARAGRHRVRVRGDGRLRETFFFTFDGEKPLQLSYVGFYDSWRLGPLKGTCPRR
ncbi:MAG: hypothetical protein ACOZQL_39515 [Myxococcota bacterium]